MPSLQLLAVAALVVVAALALSLALLAARRRDTIGARSMGLMDLALAVWALAYAVELALPSVDAKMLCTKIVYIGVVTTAPAWLLFAAGFTRSDAWLSRRTLTLLALVPVTTLTLVWTNEAHGLIWRELRPATLRGVSTLASSYGPWFFVHAAYSYVLLAVGSLLILRALLHARHLQRRQSLVLLAGVAAPWLGNALHLLRLSPIYPLDPTPFMFGVSALSFGWSVVWLRMLDVVPVAYNAIVASMDDALIVLDERGRVADVNPAAERLLGQKLAAVMGRSVGEALSALPGLLALLTRENARERAEAALTLDTPDGQCRYAATITPLRDERARHTGQMIVLRDTTAEYAAAERQRLLAEASAVLSSSLDHETTLRTITRLAVTSLADMCVIHLRGPDDAAQPVAFACVDPIKERLIRKLYARYPLLHDAPYSYQYVLRTGRSELAFDITNDDLVAIARNDEHLALLQELALQSSMCVPLIARERILGAVTFTIATPGRHYGPDDLALAEEIGRRAALAVDNARLFAELSESERRYRAASVAAEEASNAKSLFLANMSHEIRTPMNGVIVATDLLGMTNLDAQQREYIDILRSTSAALLALIEDILDISKIEAGKLALESAPVDLLACVREAIDLVAMQARAKGIAVSYHIAPGVPPVVSTDGARLRQILLNLLGNAVKFTERGEVVVSVGAESKVLSAEANAALDVDTQPSALSTQHSVLWTLHFSVRDTGIGIDPAHQQRLFQPFTQVDGSLTRRYGGTGLGLAISKRLSELLGGSIEVESAPGRGSTFRFSIRAEPVAGAALERASASAPLVAARQPHELGLRLLLVEDDAANRVLTLHLLRALGYAADTVAHGRGALEALERTPYDILLLDIQLPDIDGLEVVTAIEQQGGRIARPYIIAVTASATNGARERYLAAGVDDCVVKPIRREELAQALAQGGAQVRAARAATARSRSGASLEGAIDPEAREEMHRLLGPQAPELMRTLAASFLEDAASLVASVRAAVGEGDVEALLHALHRLKSSSVVVSAFSLSRLCAQFEALVATGERRQWPGMLRRVEDEFASVQRALAPLVDGEGGDR